MKPMKFLLAASALAVAFGPGAAMAGDPAAGEKVYKKCATCHAVEEGKHKVGPSLAGVFGRQAGAADRFKYSDVMMSSGVTWDAAALDQYLAAPKEFMPGNKMAFPGLKKPEDRENVIAYIESLGN